MRLCFTAARQLDRLLRNHICTVGPAWCFTINGISFLAVIYNLTQMRFAGISAKPASKINVACFLDGFKYLKTQKMILIIMIIVSSSSMFGMSLVTLFPAWAVQILHGNAATNGILQTARGVGAFFVHC